MNHGVWDEKLLGIGYGEGISTGWGDGISNEVTIGGGTKSEGYMG